MKKIIILYYSQFGQTKTMVDEFIAGIDKTSTQIDCIKVEPTKNYPTPWSIRSFFTAFPASFNGKKIAINEIPLLTNVSDYDLVVFAGQIWFLSPSIPMWNLMLHPQIQKLVINKPVLCLYTARNMWFNGVSKISLLLKDLGAKRIQNFILTDTSPSWATFVTTPRWMLTGKKNAFWFFPEAGIKPPEFKRIFAFSQQLNVVNFDLTALKSSDYSHKENAKDLIIESFGVKLFGFWAKIFQNFTNENSLAFGFLLVLFRLNLVLSIIVLTILASVASLLFSKQIESMFELKQLLLIDGNPT